MRKPKRKGKAKGAIAMLAYDSGRSIPTEPRGRMVGDTGRKLVAVKPVVKPSRRRPR